MRLFLSYLGTHFDPRSFKQKLGLLHPVSCHIRDRGLPTCRKPPAPDHPPLYIPIGAAVVPHVPPRLAVDVQDAQNIKSPSPQLGLHGLLYPVDAAASPPRPSGMTWCVRPLYKVMDTGSTQRSNPKPWLPHPCGC